MSSVSDEAKKFYEIAHRSTLSDLFGVDAIKTFFIVMNSRAKKARVFYHY